MLVSAEELWRKLEAQVQMRMALFTAFDAFSASVEDADKVMMMRKMKRRSWWRLRGTCLVLLGCCFSALAASAGSATEATEVHDLISRADALMKLGVIEKGATRSFEEATALLKEAEARL